MKDRRGFTLIELIITIAILGILVVAVFSMFDTGIINIVRAGDRTDAVLENQTDVNAEIKEYYETGNDAGEDTVTVNIIDFISEPIEGKLIVINSDAENLDAGITTFVPDKDQSGE